MKLVSHGRGVPADNAQLYLPSAADYQKIAEGTFDLQETPVGSEQTLAKSKLMNFEFCMRNLEQHQELTNA